jgi:hypothetical protein
MVGVQVRIYMWRLTCQQVLFGIHGKPYLIFGISFMFARPN